MINVFVGYDTKEKMAFNVLSYSILKIVVNQLLLHQYISII